MKTVNGNPGPRYKQWGPRVGMISDRSPLNFEALADYAVGVGMDSDSFRQRFPLHVGGVITPGAEFNLQETVMRRMQLRERHLRTPAIGSPINQEGSWGDEWIGSMHYGFSDGFELTHLVMPYSMAEFKRDPELRTLYNRQLIDALKAMGAELVFLDNFKLILDKSVAEEFKGHIINVHPSVLPLHKGWRTEKAAFEAGHSDALGYTFHEVIPDLDRGPVIFSATVDFSDLELEFDGTLTDANLEEALRLRIIAHQSLHVPRILAIYGSEIERKVVSGLDAFIAEDRPEFFHSDEYRSLVQHEKASAEAEGHDFVEYGRMLFDIEGDGNFRTLESIIGVERTGMFEKVSAGIRTYRTTLLDQSQIGDVVTTAQERGAYRSMRFVNTHPTRGGALEITGTSGLEDVFLALGVDFEVVNHPSRVTAPRRQPVSVPIR